MSRIFVFMEDAYSGFIIHDETYELKYIGGGITWEPFITMLKQFNSNTSVHVLNDIQLTNLYWIKIKPHFCLGMRFIDHNRTKPTVSMYYYKHKFADYLDYVIENYDALQVVNV